MRILNSISVLVLFSFLSFSTFGQNWQPVGPSDLNEASVNPLSSPSIAIDAAGHPYIAYRYTNAAAHVRMFNGNTWEQVGDPGVVLSIPPTDYFIMMDGAGVPTIIYQDNYNSDKAGIKKFTGGSWVNHGHISAGAASKITAAVDASGKLYCAYADGTKSNKLTVSMVADGLPAVDMGTFSPGGVTAVSMVIDGYMMSGEGSGYAYIAYGDVSNGNLLSVIRVNNTTSEYVGAPVISAGAVNFYSSIALDPSGVPYVAFADGANGNKITVKKFDGANWVDVGSPYFSMGAVSNVKLKINAGGDIYAAYTDSGNDQKPMLKRFDGSNWIDAGAEFSYSMSFYQNFTLDATGTPYSIFTQNSFGGKAVVKKLTGNTWSVIGDQGASAGAALYASMVSNSSGVPYIVYTDYDKQENTLVKRFDGNSWVTVGGSGLSPNGAFDPCIAMSSNDIPYVFYVDYVDGGTVKKFDGSSWINVGTPGFLGIDMHNTAIAVDAVGTPYVAYANYISTKINVQKFDGSNWVHVGLADFSMGAADYISLALDAGGVPYVTYQDAGNGNKAMVKKFDGSNWVDVGTAGISTGAASSNSLAIDGSGTLYVSYYDGTEISVKRFDGSNWIDVGATASGQINDMTFGVDDNDVPYIAYILSGGSDIAVKKFDGSNWVNAGNTLMIARTQDRELSIAFGANNVPLVSYMNGGVYVKSLGPVVILPLRLTAFNGRIEKGNGLLNWKTDDEINTREFIVERSTDGRHYAKAGAVAAANVSGVHQYAFTDRNVDQLGASVIHYRLKQVDIDGSATYSRVLILPLDQSANRVQCYPNPVTSETNLTITLDKAEQVQARIIDNMGKVVAVQQWQLSAGTTSLSIDMNSLSKGLYYLSIRSISLNRHIPLIKQ